MLKNLKCVIYLTWKYQTLFHFLCSCLYWFMFLLSSQFYWHIRLKLTADFDPPCICDIVSVVNIAFQPFGCNRILVYRIITVALVSDVYRMGEAYISSGHRRCFVFYSLGARPKHSSPSDATEFLFTKWVKPMDGKLPFCFVFSIFNHENRNSHWQILPMM